MNEHTMEYVAKELSNADCTIRTTGRLLQFTKDNYEIQLVLNKAGNYEDVKKLKFNADIIEEPLEDTINELTPILELFRERCEVLQYHTPKIMEDVAKKRVIYNKRAYNVKVIDNWHLQITHRETQCLFTYNMDGAFETREFNQNFVNEEIMNGCYEVEELFWKKYDDLLEKYNKQ